MPKEMPFHGSEYSLLITVQKRLHQYLPLGRLLLLKLGFMGLSTDGDCLDEGLRPLLKGLEIKGEGTSILGTAPFP